MLSFQNLSLRRNGELLLEHVSMTLYQGAKVGLVGANGIGKTSLFKLITGELDVDTGNLALPRQLKIAHMAQEVHASQQTALTYVLAGDDTIDQILTDIREAEDAGAYSRLASLHESLADNDGYRAKSRAEKLLTGLGFQQDQFQQPLNAFSGGWRVRLNLARTLMKRSDLLLLDEPTNHLDLDAILWLAEWIKNYEGTLILISHDRELLDDCVTQIAFMHHQSVELYSGSYSQFELTRAERLATQQKQFTKQQKEIRHMEDFVRRFRFKASKAKQAQSRLKALNKMAQVAEVHLDSPFNFQINAAERISDPLLELEAADLGYEQPVLSKINLSIRPGDRIGLLGANGAGKSTLLKTLKGELNLLAGERICGAHLRIGYFSQHQVDDLELDLSAIEQLQKLDPLSTETQLRNFLGGFNFQGSKAEVPVQSFSGGEKTRLALALVSFSQPNLLLLDEPTNHLDMDMRRALTNAMNLFSGALIVISHDRHLLSSTVESLLMVGNQSLFLFKGDLAAYRDELINASSDADTSVTQAKDQIPNPHQSKPVSNHKTQKRLQGRIKSIEKSLDRFTG
ncbi:MAG: ABC-F family ATP-binding cassette domain-containing protein, partial [Gammaproteobacteria bacterium]|nr:ABC-F family ATP-binding cassette domain-containing protein [Gammaproteobacteria bacterium]